MLPDSRNTTYTAGDPVKSVDLNDIQDCIAALAARWRWKIPILNTDTSGPWHGTDISDGTLAAVDLVSAAIAIVPLDVAVGDIIYDFGVNAIAGTSALVVSLHHNDGAGADTVVATFTTAAAAGGRLTMVGVAGALAPHTVLDGVGYWIRVVGTGYTLCAAGTRSGL